MSASAGRVLLLFKGEYDGSATYAPMDVVKYGVSSFVCKQESTGNLPTNTTYWQVLAQGISNMSPEAIGIGYGISSGTGSTRTATLADYNLTPNGIVAVTFSADVPAEATLNINSQGTKPIYFRGSAIVANVIKGGDTVTFAYDGTHYDILCIDGGAGHKIINSAGTELTQRDGLQFTDGLEAADDSQGAKTKVGMNLPIVPRATWDAMSAQEKTAYIASHYRFGVELPDTSGVINAEYMKLLWENPNTTQAFAAQTITLSSADYDFLLVISRQSGYMVSTICKKGQNALMTAVVGAIRANRLATYVSDTSYLIGQGYDATTVNNEHCIPVAVYGIKKDFQFKVNAIASNLSTRADHCFLDDEVTTVEDALNEGFIYSTEERYGGKWIDGNDWYYKTVDCGTLPNNTSATIAHNISNLGHFIGSIEGIAYRAVDNNTYPMPYYSSASDYIECHASGSSVYITTPKNYSQYNGYVTLRYTKTS